jgi:hypothetical protein
MKTLPEARNFLKVVRIKTDCTLSATVA